MSQFFPSGSQSIGAPASAWVLPMNIQDWFPLGWTGWISLQYYQLWIFIEWTDAEAENPILWPPDSKSQLIGKDPDAGKDWSQKEKGEAKDEMVR